MKKKYKDKISIIVPCYNEEEALPIFYKEINALSQKMDSIDFEFLFIDDGSYDNTLEILRKIAKKDKRVKYYSFSKNFGKEAGMYAGLEKSTGNFVAIMDADLQDPPEMLAIMYKELQKEEYECVALYSTNHQDYVFPRKQLTKLWYKIEHSISESKQPAGARDFRLMKRIMVDAIISTREYNRYTKGLFDFVGFKTKWISYEIPNRKVGKSKFSLSKLIKYAIDGITSFSPKPLLLSAYIGMAFCLLAFVAIVFIIGKTIFFGDPVAGWPSMTCIIIFVSGIQLFFLGIIGTYLSKIYLEVKNRPIYIIKETNEK